MKRLVFISISSLFLALTTGCGQMVSSISSSISSSESSTNRIEPDFIPGEIVTTGSGHEVKAVIGDITERVTTSSGHTVEAVFYQ
jgi:hypothetical protein